MKMLRQAIFVFALCLLVAPSFAQLTRLHVETLGVKRAGAAINNLQAIPDANTILGAGLISAEVGASGYIVSDHLDIVCGYDQQDSCQNDFPVNSEIVLRATAHSGSRFAGWVVPSANEIEGAACFKSTAFPMVRANTGERIKYPPPIDQNEINTFQKSQPLYTSSCRIRLVGSIVNIRAFFVIDETRVVDSQPNAQPVLPFTVNTVTYRDNVLSAFPVQFAQSDYNVALNSRSTGIPEIDYEKKRDGAFDISFLGTQLDDEVLVYVKQVQWICNDDVDRFAFPLADRALQNLPVVAQNKWTDIKASPILPQFGVCQVNVTVLTNSTDTKISRELIFTHVIRVLGGKSNAASATHILAADHQVSSAWDLFSSFITEIPAGIRINARNGIERRRFRQQYAPPAGKYAMDVTLQVKGTTVDNDAVVCTAGFHKFGTNTLILPDSIDYKTTTNSGSISDATPRRLRDWIDVWIPSGSVSLRHLKRVIELGNNETPPDLIVICKSLGTVAKRNIDADLDTQARSIAVGPITTTFRRLDTPWVLDSVVMSYRFGNMVTRVPS